MTRMLQSTIMNLLVVLMFCTSALCSGIASLENASGNRKLTIHQRRVVVPDVNVYKQTDLLEPGVNAYTQTDVLEPGVNAYKQTDVLEPGVNAYKQTDSFTCSPCMCSQTEKKQVTANCSARGLAETPRRLPIDVWSIDMSGNRVIDLNFSTAMNYPKLFLFKLSCDNFFKHVTNFSSTSSTHSQLKTLDLSNNGISTIDDASFAIFPRLNNLTLRGNYISNIRKKTFFGLERLHYLDLSSNLINYIHDDAFGYFARLKYLDLSCNPNLGYSQEKLPPKLFMPLTNVNTLFLHGVSKVDDLTYPNETITRLPSLWKLSLDGLTTEFGKEFQTLKNLKSLEVGNYKGCSGSRIDRGYFMNVPHLTRFFMIGCSLNLFDPDAFFKVNLTSLSLVALPNYDLHAALENMKSLYNSSLNVLKLIRLYNKKSWLMGLRREDAKYLTFLNLTLLDLSDNLLVFISKNFVKLLPKTIEHLILSHNRLTRESLPLTMFSPLTELSNLDVSSQNMISDENEEANVCPNVKPAVNCRKAHSSELDGITQMVENGGRIKTGFQNSTEDQSNINFQEQVRCDDHVLDKKLKEVPHSLSVPVKLARIEASRFIDFGKNIFEAYAQRNSCLNHVQLYDTYLTTSFIGALPVPVSVKKAEMGSNYIKEINVEFFPQNNSLIYLDIHNNILGPYFAQDVNGTTFERLGKVIHLDLRMNLISELPKQFFVGLKKLQTLRLSDNSLQVLNTSFDNLKDLRQIDLSYNSIAWISKDVRDDLDEIASLHNLYIDLTNNPLPCTCNMLDVLHWMEGTKVVLLNRDILICRFDDGSNGYIGDLKVRFRALQRWCATKVTTFVICVASMIVIVVLLGFAMLYRFRWRLRYVRYIVISEFCGFKPKTHSENGFKFDAYILYTEETRNFVIRDCVKELEEKRGHKLCFEDRNFVPGSPIVSDIVSAVNNSHKTVPVVTPEFYDGDFSEYGVKMAVMEEIFKKRLALHLFIYQPTPSEVMSHEFLVAMKRNDYTAFPDDEDASEEIIQNFWDRLSRAIGHTSSNESHDFLIS